MMKHMSFLLKQQDVFIADWLRCAFQGIIKSSIEEGGHGRLSIEFHLYSMPGTFPILLHLFLTTPGDQCYYDPYCLDMEMSIKEHSQLAQGHTGKL